MEEDYYHILQIPLTSTTEQINKSYHILARKYHPDRNKDDDAVALFLKIKKAYDVLSDPEAKKEYDAKIKARILKQQRSHKLKTDLYEREMQYERQRREEKERHKREKEERLREREEMIRRMEEENRIRKEEEEAALRAKHPSSRYSELDLGGMDDESFERMVLDKMRRIKRKRSVET